MPVASDCGSQRTSGRALILFPGARGRRDHGDAVPAVPRAPGCTLHPLENIRRHLRVNLLERVFENYEAIIDAACEAWNWLIKQPEAITSIGLRDWAHIGQA